MNSIRNKPRRVQIIAILFFLIGLGTSYYYFSQKDGRPDWQGNWEITYYYEHQPELLFTGSLNIQQTDSWAANLSLFPPKSTRPENILIEDLQLMPSGALEGILEHNTYKIRGGYLQEHFVWELDAPNLLRGVGKCQAYCAEGTAETRIIWEGVRDLEE